jgi:hypothetical protein
MVWSDLEKSFLKAWGTVFCKKKLLMTFVALSLCGFFFICCSVLSTTAGSWMKLSFLFLPILLSTVFLFVLGVLLIRIYAYEAKGIELGLGKLFTGSLDLAISTSYLSLPPILTYLCLWMFLGIFFLLKEIPWIGPFFNVIFAFGPFLLIFSALLLCLINFFLLFFLAPAAVGPSVRRFELARRVWISIKSKPFLHLSFLFIGVLPALCIGGTLSIAAMLTTSSFALEGPSFALALEWFFIMLPFTALLSPAIVFFFQFAAESHQHCL